MTTNQRRGSKTLAQLASKLGVKVKNPIAYYPQTGKFESAEERGREMEALDRWQLGWLINFAQRGHVLQEDSRMVAWFTAMHMDAEPKITSPELQKFASDVAHELKVFLLDRKPWTFPLRSTRAALEPFSYSTTIFKTDDWRTAFRLRTAELVAQHQSIVRSCGRTDCGRLFVASGKQTFCSKRCSHLKRLHAYRDNLKKKAQQQEEKKNDGTQTRKA